MKFKYEWALEFGGIETQKSLRRIFTLPPKVVIETVWNFEYRHSFG